ncbi:transcription termination factor MTEF1, chloroplastic [Amborella trichopoda]|uniref:Uncharacterized protein n=1 Tax=Amborella trichopoda TaxID=13333 RepID=W1PFK5_AMBTC|nr:transcription termination factor MTEF1, chloroplastic [Amborella trichopoda]ERN06499.1 hypothetical protein AMTR_s00058p00057440 [Amborella trichopoda]|eukprot:XP_006844824.1 transcription termination factor MTEF1, chloroplastic [Amborella trichopoda]
MAICLQSSPSIICLHSRSASLPQALCKRFNSRNNIKRNHTSKDSKISFNREAKILDGFGPLRPLDSTMELIDPPGSDSGLQFREKLIYLEKMKVSSIAALERNPLLRSTSINQVKLIEKCLSSMGLTKNDIGRIFSMLPQLLTCDPDKDLYPVFEFLLNEVKIPYEDIRKTIVRCPRLLVSSVRDQLRPAFYFLQRLGFVGPHAVNCQTTLLLVSNVENTLIPKLDYLQSLGFSYRESVKMVLRSPGLFTFSIRNNFEPKVDYFLNEIGGDLEELKRFPQYFSFSLEGKIKPRHRLLVEYNLSLPLADMLKVSDGEFRDLLVEMRLQAVDKKLQ